MRNQGQGVRRGVIVARIKPGSQQEVARIFAESDQGDLPKIAGVQHRSLFAFGDVYIHLIEMDGEVDERVQSVSRHPLFQEISEKLATHIEPYDPSTWRSPRDAAASEFYSWDAPS